MFRIVAFVIGTTALVLASASASTDDARKPGARMTPRPQSAAPSVIADPAAPQSTGAQPACAWIGVRGVPAPEALESHLGRGGVMIANVANGSPADSAGVQRFDVLVSFNGQPIKQMQDLVEAVSAAGAGKSVALVVIRGGKEQKLSITPAARPVDENVTFKYEEPRAADADPSVQYFGHQLKRDPAGNWIFQPFGKIDSLPDDVKDMLNDANSPAWLHMPDVWKDFHGNPFRMRIQVDPNDPNGNMFFFGDDESPDDKPVDIQISVDEDGQKVTIQRTPDGKVSIKRTDADGKSSESSFDNLEAFRKADPEGYKTYRRYSGYRARAMITLPPEWKDLAQMQKDWQAKIEKSLHEAHERLLDVQKNAGAAQQKIQMWKDDDGSGAATSRSESVSISVEPDGRIKLNHTFNGESKSYEFKDRDDFRTREPELFDRYGSFLGQVPAKKRSQAFPLAMAALG